VTQFARQARIVGLKTRFSEVKEERGQSRPGQGRTGVVDGQVRVPDDGLDSQLYFPQNMAA
jgi:hypothetical protein